LLKNKTRLLTVETSGPIKLRLRIEFWRGTID
jgi:hypothetical protein